MSPRSADRCKCKNVFPPGIEPGTLRVWGARDNHYTTETLRCQIKILIYQHTVPEPQIWAFSIS